MYVLKYIIFRPQSADIFVSVLELLEVGANYEESLTLRNVEEQGCEISMLQHT